LRDDMTGRIKPRMECRCR